MLSEHNCQSLPWADGAQETSRCQPVRWPDSQIAIQCPNEQEPALATFTQLNRDAVDQTKDNAAIFALPDEILAEIFQLMAARQSSYTLESGLSGMGTGVSSHMAYELITVIPRVCRRFRAVCQDLVRIQCLNFDWDGPSLWARSRRDSVLGTLICHSIRPFAAVAGFDFKDSIGLQIGVIDAVAASCPGVSHISLNGCTQVDDAWLSRIGKLLPTLKVVHLKRCGRVTDEGLKSLLQSCHLKSLHVPNGRGVHGEWFSAANAEHIQALCLRQAGYVTDDWLDELVLSIPQIHTLNLSGCKEVSTIGVISILTHCTRLRGLDLRGCRKVADAAAWHQLRQSPTLEDLVLAGCALLTDESLACIATACPNLRRLSLSGCGISDRGLESVGAFCHSLRELQLCNALAVTDFGLGCITRGCPVILRISLFNCTATTDIGVSRLVKRCTSLRWLDLRSCWGVSRACIESIQREVPRIEIPPRWDGTPIAPSWYHRRRTLLNGH